MTLQEKLKQLEAVAEKANEPGRLIASDIPFMLEYMDVFSPGVALRLLKVVDKLVSQKSQWIDAFEHGDIYIRDVGAWKIAQRADEELLKILEGE